MKKFITISSKYFLRTKPSKRCFVNEKLFKNLSKSSKSKDHIKCLDRRLDLWEQGDFDELVRESRAIQNRILSYTNKKISTIKKRFSDLMFLGKVNAALKLLSNESSTGLVPINDQIINTLQEKHPQAQPKFDDLLLEGPVVDVHPLTLHVIDAELIQKMAAKTIPFRIMNTIRFASYQSN